MSVYIRPLGPNDLRAISALADAAEREGFRFLSRFLLDATQDAVALDAPGEFFFGAFADSTLLAIGGVTPDPYLPAPRVGRLRHVYVAAPHRRQGVGERLVAALERRACTEYDRLRLRTDTVDAARFYERVGYTARAHATATHERYLRSDLEAS